MRSQAIHISKDKELLKLELIHKFLENSYWAKGRTLSQVQKSIENSISFGVYESDEQVGFARVITDQTTFAYIADLFIVEPKRGQGYSKKLMEAILEDTELVEVKKWYLITKDAQKLYNKFGFTAYSDPEKTLMFIPPKQLK